LRQQPSKIKNKKIIFRLQEQLTQTVASKIVFNSNEDQLF